MKAPAIHGPGSSGPLPELRQDLRLVGTTTDHSGNRLWKLYDPLRHRFIALSGTHYAMLDVWAPSASPDAMIEAAWSRHAESITPEDIAEFSMFLLGHGLAYTSEDGAWRPSFAAAEKYRSAHLLRLLHNYLFFRIPIVNPEQFLRATLPLVRPLATRKAAYVLVLLAIAGFFLVSREWDQFVESAYRLASWSGASSVFAAILFVKLLHELGHGYVAAHYGCRVPSLGVAVILGAPLLYVDVTDSWKLKSQSARLAIDGAGIAVDISIAVFASLMWVLIPDGAMRNVAFTLATAGWLTSLAFNLNPFMKFDGYHLIADGFPLPNLQERALGLAHWKMRETLFGLGAKPPEDLQPMLRRALVAFGSAIWIYRVVLFTGIAIAIYLYFFKIFGLILFAVEIGYFIVAPIIRELTEWISMRHTLTSSNRTKVTAAIGVALLAAIVVPWSTTITVQAVLEPVDVTRVHLPLPAKLMLINVANGDAVMYGAPLMKLASAELERELERVRLRTALVQLRLARISSDASDRELSTVLAEEHRSLQLTASGLRKQMAELEVAAPSTGAIASLLNYAAPGRWVVPSEALAVVHGMSTARIRGLVEATDANRIRTGMRATFIPNDLLQPTRKAILEEVATANAATIEPLQLAQSFGGQVPSRLTSKDRAVPISAQYAVIATLEAPPRSDRTQPTWVPQVGVLLVEGEVQSLLSRFWNRVLLVLVRESGF